MGRIRIAVGVLAMAAAVLTTSTSSGRQAAVPGLPRPDVLNPDYHVRLATQHLATAVAEYDRPHARYLSWYALGDEPGRKLLPQFKRVLAWWLHQLSTGPDVVRPLEVPGSEGLLWYIDLRDYRWNADAWRAVAQREPYFVEPGVASREAEALRRLVGERQPAEKAGTYHVVAVVRADWLFRETVESDRSPSYYDLLFAGQRFKGGTAGTAKQVEEEYTETVPETVREQVYRPDLGGYVIQEKTVNREVKKTRTVTKDTPPAAGAFVDFPKNEDDWNEFFGVKAVVEHLKKQSIDVTRGAVVAGSLDDPLRGSIVARNNRVVTIIPIPTGVAMKTYDVKRTEGDADHIEKVPEIVVGKIKFDAGELLASLPNGGQAGLLVNGKGERTEVAPTTFAHNKADPRYVDVRTMMGCVTCHAPDGGVIPPRDMFKELLASGVDLKIKDRDLRNRTKAFFLEWEDSVKDWQRPYQKLLARTTSDPLKPGDKGLTGGQLVKEFLALRNWYDDPVGPRQAATELGTPEAVLKLMATRSPLARMNMLAQGRPMPREVWERNSYREALLLLDASRDDDEVKKVWDRMPR